MIKYSLLFILFFFISLFAFIAGVQSWKLNSRVKKFDKVQARILDKSIGEKQNASSSGPKARYRVNVLYEFDYQGKLFQGKNYYSMELMGGEQVMSREDVQKILDSLSEKTEIFVNPTDPEESFMVQNSSLQWLFFGASILVFLTGCLVFGIKILFLLIK
ncbi:MAG: DUF3592 domain-containing protein [Leptospira sp.]|nr:DUF3592 domain-containing protein [Leptospira sp.]